MGWRVILRTAALWAVLTSSAAPAQEQSFAVIVHPDCTAVSLTRSRLERYYRRWTRNWPDGTEVRPINLPFDHPLRERFSRVVLRSSTDSLVTFWNRMYFRGVLPPVVLKSAASVRAYVAKTPGAIGYVPLGAEGSSKTLELTGDD